MRRDEDWFDAVGKYDWRMEQIEKREKELRAYCERINAAMRLNILINRFEEKNND